MSSFFFPCPQKSCHFPAHSPGFLLSNSCHSQCTFAFGSKSLIVKLLGRLFGQLAPEHFLSPKKGRLGGEASKDSLRSAPQCFTPPGIYASSSKAAATIWQDPGYYTCRFTVPPQAKPDQQLPREAPLRRVWEQRAGKRRWQLCCGRTESSPAPSVLREGSRHGRFDVGEGATRDHTAL